MSDVERNLKAIYERIKNACIACDRSPSEVRLMLATKTNPAERIIEALKCGETLIGENRVQELVAKADALSGWPIEKHMIGHLQSNKAAKALDHVTCIQSIDRMSIAERLNTLLAKREKQLDVYLQFNTSGESSKFGFDPNEAVSVAREIAQFEHLKIKGVMTIGLLVPEPVLSRSSLRDLRIIYDRLNEEAIPGIDLQEISMGMSTDLEVAIEEGSTMVRIGTDIFGKRETPPGIFWNENDPSREAPI